MRGAIVLATEQGLGYLAKAFFDNGIIDRVYVQRHTSRTNHPEWYPGRARVDRPDILLDCCDSILLFEEAFHWEIIPLARKAGIKTALMPMYECTRNPLPYQPDTIISPSLLDQQYYPESVFLPVPVRVPWRLRSRARVFVHNAGNGGLGGRNGTRELLQAMRFVKNPLQLIVRSQVPIELPAGAVDPRIKFIQGTVPESELWSEGDVFVFPERFNGLSLPLQEAYAAGMCVMAGDRFPINTWLPREPLIPVDRYTKERIAVEFDCAHYKPETIAAKMDEWYDRDISALSRRGASWAMNNSWGTLKEKYLKALA